MPVIGVPISSTIDAIAAILQGAEGQAPVFLLGAGASVSAGVPLAREAVARIAKAAYDRNQSSEMSLRHVPSNETYLDWLREQPWFLHGDDRLAENFPLAVENLLHPAEFRKKVLMEMVGQRLSGSIGYDTLAKLVSKGLIRTVLTTNFDPCLPRAIHRINNERFHIAEINKTDGDLSELDPYARCQIVWLHGSVEKYSDRNATEEVATLPTALVGRLRPLLDNSPIVVIGYRGAETSVMAGLFEAALCEPNPFRRGIYWCRLRNEVLHPNVHRLAEALPRSFHVVDTDGFDDLMSMLLAKISEQSGSIGAPLWVPQGKLIEYVSAEDLAGDAAPLKIVTYGSGRSDPALIPWSVWKTYQRLFPVDTEREEPETIVDWLKLAFLDEGSDWIHMFSAIYQGSDCIGISFVSASRSYGWGFWSYLGVLQDYRNIVKLSQFVEHVITELESVLPNPKGIFFAVERYDDALAATTLEKLDRDPEGGVKSLSPAERFNTNAIRRLAIFSLQGVGPGLFAGKRDGQASTCGRERGPFFLGCKIGLSTKPWNFQQPALSSPYIEDRESPLWLMLYPLGEICKRITGIRRPGSRRVELNLDHFEIKEILEFIFLELFLNLRREIGMGTAEEDKELVDYLTAGLETALAGADFDCLCFSNAPILSTAARRLLLRASQADMDN